MTSDLSKLSKPRDVLTVDLDDDCGGDGAGDEVVVAQTGEGRPGGGTIQKAEGHAGGDRGTRGDLQHGGENLVLVLLFCILKLN